MELSVRQTHPRFARSVIEGPRFHRVGASSRRKVCQELGQSIVKQSMQAEVVERAGIFDLCGDRDGDCSCVEECFKRERVEMDIASRYVLYVVCRRSLPPSPNQIFQKVGIYNEHK